MRVKTSCDAWRAAKAAGWQPRGKRKRRNLTATIKAEIAAYRKAESSKKRRAKRRKQAPTWKHELQRRRAELLRNRTPHELILAAWLASSGLRFTEQTIAAGRYIVDLLVDGRLAVEADGKHHDEPAQRQHDRERDATLASRGIRTLRFRNSTIRAGNKAAILAAVRTALSSAQDHPAP